ncbi:hypothetical protein D3C87_1388120 [compost metagenome]
MIVFFTVLKHPLLIPVAVIVKKSEYGVATNCHVPGILILNLLFPKFCNSTLERSEINCVTVKFSPALAIIVNS